MNGNSKREKVDGFIRRAVWTALMEHAWNYPHTAEVLKNAASTLAISVAHNVAQDAYRFKELQDILAWKKPPKEPT